LAFLEIFHEEKRAARYNRKMKWTILAFVLAAAPLAPAYAAQSTVSVEHGASTYVANSPLAPTVRNLSPSPGDTVKAFFPHFAATIDTHGRAPVRRQSVRLYVDGQDVTTSASIDGNTVSYLPRAHLKAGWHDVFLQGADTANHAFSTAWVFKTLSPDVDDPISGDGGFAFVPVGFGGPFQHFFLISPFDGFGQVQFCNGFQFPLLRAGLGPVFFGTVPIGFGTPFLGCNPGLVFTPFQAGLGQLNSLFFPIEIAGPGIFQHGFPGRRRPLIFGPAAGIAAPPGVLTAPGGIAAPGVIRTVPTMSVFRSTGAIVPVTGVPVTGIQGLPINRAPILPGTRVNFPPAAGAPIVMPPISVPQPFIPH
jgi:hypothetical protein